MTASVTIYLRSPTKKSHKVEVPSKISMGEIKALAQERMGIARDRQLLYLNGKNVTDYGCIRLQPLSIIHVSSTDDLCPPHGPIHLTLNVMNFLHAAPLSARLTVQLSGQDLVGEFLTRLEKQVRSLQQITSEKAQFYLLESSRILDRDKSFLDQEISRSTEIICMVTEHELKTRFSNDTKEEILHDISELLGFGEDADVPDPTPKEPTRQRYPRHDRRQPPPHPERRRERQPVIAEEEESLSSNKMSSSATLPNFKKKVNPVVKSFEVADRPLAKKIKALKPKREIEQLLNSQQTQRTVFETAEVVAKPEPRAESEDPTEIEIHKPAPLIPKVMPIRERRKIRLEIEKLFDLEESPQAETPAQEEERPPPVKREAVRDPGREKMRFSMGSRPAFLEALRVGAGRQE